MALTRFTAQGNVDTDFGASGLAIVEFGTGLDETCTDITQLANGHLIALGCASVFPQAKTIIAGLSPGNTTDVDHPENAPAMLLEYYPNPASDWLYFKGDFGTDARITLTDSKGSVLKQAMCNDGKMLVANLPAGLYYLVLETSTFRYGYSVTVLR